MTLVADGGPAAATMTAIARMVGAPTGSIYHRFESRAAILASAWNIAYRSFVERVAPPLRAGRPRDAALALIGWAREDRRRARFILLNDAGALFDDTPPPEPMRVELRRLEEDLDAAFRICLDALRWPGGGYDDEDAARAKFLVFDAPIALIRPQLLGPSGVADFADGVIMEMFEAVSPARGARATAAA